MTDLIALRLGRDLRQSPQYGRYMELLGWEVANVAGVRLFIRHIGPLLFAKIRRAPPSTDYLELLKYIKLHKFFITQIDPESEFPPPSFHRAKDQILGTKTLLLDLRPSPEHILSTFKSETRLKLHKLLRQSGSPVINDYSGFYSILHQGLSDIGVWCPPRAEYQKFISAFGTGCFSLTIDNLSGCLVVIHDRVAEYYYAGSLREGKTNNFPYLVVWEAMLEAKKRGALVWDFNGLIDPRWPDKRWAGFSFFKSRFGGTELSFSGTFTKYGWW